MMVSVPEEKNVEFARGQDGISFTAERYKTVDEKRVTTLKFDVKFPTMESVECTVSKLEYEGMPSEKIQEVCRVQIHFEDFMEKPMIKIYRGIADFEDVNIKTGDGGIEGLTKEPMGAEIISHRTEISCSGLAMKIGCIIDTDDDCQTGIEIEVDGKKERFFPPSKHWVEELLRTNPEQLKKKLKITTLKNVDRAILFLVAVTDIHKKGGFAGIEEIREWFEQRKLGDERVVSIAEDMLMDETAIYDKSRTRPDGRTANEYSVSANSRHMAENAYRALESLLAATS